jgi:hypothetical protein
MTETIALIGAAVGIIASLIEILQFLKILTNKHKVLVLTFVSLATVVCFSTWQIIDKRNEDRRIEKVKNSFVISDAKTTSASIIISGWENSGDYLGYLTQIVGFYARHKDLYKSEFESYQVQLNNFTAFFKKRREEDKYTYSSDWQELRGLATSAKEHLEKISGSAG